MHAGRSRFTSLHLLTVGLVLTAPLTRPTPSTSDRQEWRQIPAIGNVATRFIASSAVGRPAARNEGWPAVDETLP